MFSIIHSQALLMSKLSSKLSKAANLFEISTWYFSLTSMSLNFFRSNLSKSEFCLAHLLSEILSLNFATTRYWSVLQSAPLKEQASNMF
jgi:hypothetical protein